MTSPVPVVRMTRAKSCSIRATPCCLDTCEVVKLDNPSDGRAFIGMKLEGRINRATDRAAVLYLFDLDGAAGIITELLALAGRAGWRDQMHDLLEDRLAELDKLKPDDDA